MERSFSKKLILSIIKYAPWLIGIAYLLQNILSWFGINSIILSTLFGISIIPIILLCLFSNFLGFCIWNRIPLYYALTCNILNIIDFYIGIPISNIYVYIIYVILLGIFITIGAYVKNRNNVRKRNIKENST